MKLGNKIALALRGAYLAIHRSSDAAFADFGVTADQFVLLATLARGSALTQRQLSKRMSSDPSTVRAMLVLLERQGLVRRETGTVGVFDRPGKTQVSDPAAKPRTKLLSN